MNRHDLAPGEPIPEKLFANAVRTLERTDAMPPRLRRLVHEFGFSIVDAFLAAGISDERIIRHLVTTCWYGGRSQMERPASRLGSSRLYDQIDWVLTQSGSSAGAATLLGVLFQCGFVVLPLEPTALMVDASIAATGEMGLVSKREKHQGRLRAALRGGAVRMWPHLFGAAR